MQKSLPARPSLEQFKKQAKELVKEHRAGEAAAFARIREFLPALANRTNEDILLYPFALHDALSVIAREYGFKSWNLLRDKVETLQGGNRPSEPDSSVMAKFKVVTEARSKMDYDLWCSVMDEAMRTAVPKERFLETSEKISAYFQPDASQIYMGEMNQGEHTVYFWRLSSPGKTTDVLARMSIKDDLVSGLLYSPPFR